MSYTLSDITTFIPDGTPGVGWCWYTATRDSDGAFANTLVWFSAAYSAAPNVNADGSARSVDVMTGVYTGWDTADSAAATAGQWGINVNGINGTGLDSCGGTPGLDGDSTAVADIAATATDSAITSAIASALSGFTPLNYAVSITLGVYTSNTLTTPVSPVAGVYPVNDGYALGLDTFNYAGQDGYTIDLIWATVITSSIVYTSSDPTVATVTPGGGGQYAVINKVGAGGSCTLTVAVASPAAPSMTLSVDIDIS